MNRNEELKMFGVIADTLRIRGLLEMGYNITKTNLKPRFVLDIIELEEIAKSMEDLISQINNQSQTDDLFKRLL